MALALHERKAVREDGCIVLSASQQGFFLAHVLVCREHA